VCVSVWMLAYECLPAYSVSVFCVCNRSSLYLYLYLYIGIDTGIYKYISVERDFYVFIYLTEKQHSITNVSMYNRCMCRNRLPIHINLHVVQITHRLLYPQSIHSDIISSAW